ncbi:MAG: hypothetical protein ACR2PX_06215 [Endozoicomonas sp.]|uniref:hypothetical protein n=1 Tax=Endozoicomonas sp. TaxID=1892382 RepID=UPI003D9AD88D
MSREIEHFRTVEDLTQKINELIDELRDKKNSNELGVMFRVVIPPNEPTLYKEGSQGPYQLVEGVRVCDYKFEKATGLEWVIPDPNAGLSFSKTGSHLKNTRKMLSRHAKGYNSPGPANVAWWILSNFPVPNGLEFKQDSKNKHHYFLAATQKTHVSKLVEKLRWISKRMNIMIDETF